MARRKLRPAEPGRAEHAAQKKIRELDVDLPSAAAVSNIFRAANAARNYLERTVLRRFELSFSGFTVLWVLWIDGQQETRRLAAEAAITKGTLTGVLNTLEARGWIQRRRPDQDRRLTVVRLTPKGRRRMRRVFPEFNAAESEITSGLSERSQTALTAGLRSVLSRIESLDRRSA